MNEKCVFCFSSPGLDLSCLYIWRLACVRDVVYNINVTASSPYLSSDLRTHVQQASRTFSCFVLPPRPLFPHYFSPSRARTNARLHQHIELDYNLICSGRDGIEQQIIPNEENQSPGVQISRKLVRSDWFGHKRRLGGIWQITASQVDWENGREEGEEGNGETGKGINWERHCSLLLMLS